MPKKRKPRGRSMNTACPSCDFKPARFRNGNDPACRSCARLPANTFAGFVRELALINAADAAGFDTVAEYLRFGVADAAE